MDTIRKKSNDLPKLSQLESYRAGSGNSLLIHSIQFLFYATILSSDSANLQPGSIWVEEEIISGSIK